MCAGVRGNCAQPVCPVKRRTSWRASWTASGTGNGRGTTPGLPAGTTVAGASAGCDHTLALTRAGQVFAWGMNDFGQLGNGTTTDSSVPVRVPLPAGITATAVAAGCQFSLALTSKGQVLAWGRGSEGQLGNGGTADSHVAVAVARTHRARRLSLLRARPARLRRNLLGRSGLCAPLAHR